MDAPTTRLPILRLRDDQAADAQDDLVRERAVAIAINGTQVALLMALPGCEEELAAGFALSEGVIASRADLLSVRLCAAETADPDACLVRLTVPAERFAPEAGPVLTRFACGTVGASLLRREPQPLSAGGRISAAALQRVMQAMTEQQAVFRATGGTHGAAVCDAEGTLLVLREDIGRHNAADKALGHCLLHDLPLEDKALVITGRASWEMALKAAAAGVPILASMSAATARAVETAEHVGLTLVGFLRPRRMNVYCGAERIAPGASR